jgi:hypothetical protein
MKRKNREERFLNLLQSLTEQKSSLAAVNASHFLPCELFFELNFKKVSQNG